MKKLTHIDTGGHGYLSVSKKDIKAVGLNPQDISGYSGHTLTRIYLEEDRDAGLFLDACKAKGIPVQIKSSYNPRFKNTHNYHPSCFEINIGDRVRLSNEEICTITGMDHRSIYLQRANFKFYRLSAPRAFQYIEAKI